MQSFSYIGPSLRFPIPLQSQGVETFLFVLLTNLKKSIATLSWFLNRPHCQQFSLELLSIENQCYWENKLL